MEIPNHRYLGKILPKLRKKLGTTENESKIGIEAVDTNILMWWLFMSSSMKAAILLGPNYVENLEVYKNTDFEETQNLFGVTQKLISDHSAEILKVNTIESTSPSWRDLLCFMIKWSSGQKQKCLFIQTLFCVRESCQIFQTRTKDVKVKVADFKCPLLMLDSDSLVSDGRRTLDTSPHAHFSQSCQCRALDSTLTISHAHACGSRLKAERLWTCSWPVRTRNSYLRALQGHSRRNLIGPSLQDNVSIQDEFFKYIYHVGCAINLHSIMNSGLIPGGYSLSNRQTVFFLLVNPMDKEHKDPETIDLEAPRLARYMHTAWKRHQNTVYWVDIKFAQKKGWKFYQTRSNAITLYHTLPASSTSKAVRMETGEIIYEKVYEPPRPPPKISLRKWLDEGIGFRSCPTSRRQPTNPTKPWSNL